MDFSKSRAGTWRAIGVSVAALIVASAAPAASQDFAYASKPIHPGCVHALAMRPGDAVPVTTAVSLEGCTTSERSKAKVRYDKEGMAVIEDDALLGGGTFGYRVINRLDNGIFGLAIQRTSPSGEERVSLAAVVIVERPMMVHGSILRLQQIELLGEVWIPDMDLMSFRSMGNRVHFVSGVGSDRVERDVDFTRLGKMREK